MAKTDGSNLPERQKEHDSPTTLAGWIEKMKPQIEAALPKHINVDRIARIAMTAIRQTPALGKCSLPSILGALMQASQLGLEVNSPLGHAYLIPYKQECTFVMGYQGMIDLCFRSGLYKNIFAREVYENDEFDYRYGLDMDLVHIPSEAPTGEPVFYYAVYKTVNGGSDFLVWSTARVEAHRNQFSPSWNKGRSPWKDNFPAMAKKTLLRQLLKTAPKTAEVAQAVGTDNSKQELKEVDGESRIITTFPEQFPKETPEEDAAEKETPAVERNAETPPAEKSKKPRKVAPKKDKEPEAAEAIPDDAEPEELDIF